MMPPSTGMAPPPEQFNSAGSRAGRSDAPARKSRSRASFQLQAAAPIAKPAGLPADPHDGGPHEDVKDMAIYLRLDPQRDYRFMWVSQVREPTRLSSVFMRAGSDWCALLRSLL